MADQAAGAQAVKTLGQPQQAVQHGTKTRAPGGWCAGGDAGAARAQSFELPQRVHLEPELWAPENGWLTPTFKFRREPLRRRYQPAIDAMYADLAASGGKPATL